MNKITSIYKGYLELIQYLEEKFPGGVRAVYDRDSLCVLTVTPTTETITHALIVPACNKFNDLNSTQLYIVTWGNGALIMTKQIAPTLYILYAMILGGTHVKGDIPAATPLRIPQITAYVDLLKDYAISLREGNLTSKDCSHSLQALKVYGKHQKHSELGPAVKWLSERRRDAVGREEKERDATVNGLY